MGYAKCNLLAILKLERRGAKRIGHGLHLTNLTNQVGKAGADRPSSEERTNVEKEEMSTNERPPRGQLPTEGTVPPLERDPENPPMDWEEEIDLSYIDDDKLPGHVLDMLREHSSLWSVVLGTIRATEHHTTLEPGTKPIRSMPYRKEPAMREMVAKDVNKMLNARFIELASTKWASPVVLVPNKDGSLRFCVDYRGLNAKTAADSYPLPRMDDCIGTLRHAAVLTPLDCNYGY